MTMYFEMLGEQRNAIPEIIHIPSASERKPGITARHRKYSSSEESDDYENTEDVNGKCAVSQLLNTKGLFLVCKGAII